MTKSDEYRRKLETLINEWKMIIDQMEEKAKRTSALARSELLEAVEILKIKRETVQERVNEMRHSGDETWELLRKKAEAAITEMKSALEQTIAKFK